MPASRARATASVRDATPSLVRMTEMLLRTVFGLRNWLAAIRSVDQPRDRSSRTASSRAVSSGNSRGPAGAASAAPSRPETTRPSSTSPRATARMAVTISSWSDPLTT